MSTVYRIAAPLATLYFYYTRIDPDTTSSPPPQLSSAVLLANSLTPYLSSAVLLANGSNFFSLPATFFLRLSIALSTCPFFMLAN